MRTARATSDRGGRPVRDEDKPKYFIAGGILMALAFWKGRAVVQVATDFVTKGKRLNVTTLDGDGVVVGAEGERATPAELAAEMSAVVGYEVPVDIASLARMARSEGTNGKEVRMHVAFNDLADLQRTKPSLGLRSITDLVTYSKYANERGWFGDQVGRRYATSRDPYENDLRLAFKVWNDRQLGIDKADGAIKFADKSSFGVQKKTRSYDEVESEWIAEGLEPFNTPSATTDLVLFRRG